MSFGYDPDAIYQDADIEMMELREEARDYEARMRRVAKLAAAGQKAEAAMACPHDGSGWPTNSPAAANPPHPDPEAGNPGFRCSGCGSWLTEDPWDAREAGRSCFIKKACQMDFWREWLPKKKGA